MARKWDFSIDGKQHTVEVKIHLMGEREVIVDSKVVKALSPTVTKSRTGAFGSKTRTRDLGDQMIEFEVAGKPAFLQKSQSISLSGTSYNLYVDGEKIK